MSLGCVAWKGDSRSGGAGGGVEFGEVESEGQASQVGAGSALKHLPEVSERLHE
eukprot:CAMPEP_0180181028 /NCGR_PEP_ID=MMETSP0986-20121125/39906_1 /TAXON_ID=697907 /ORGANISM="non described non described, Strain CCMP2293" /LENGTH=53 /DNA_ID=CAMNT_0022134287 /DNA_START=118 /DNA_END=277 /DNA_ORIENTATION=+